MKVSELRDRSKVEEIEVEIISKEEPREVSSRYGDPLHVCDATAKDDSGEVKMTLWNEEIEQVNEGDRVRITNGWVSSYRGELQLSSGKYGKLEVITNGA